MTTRTRAAVPAGALIAAPCKFDQLHLADPGDRSRLKRLAKGAVERVDGAVALADGVLQLITARGT